MCVLLPLYLVFCQWTLAFPITFTVMPKMLHRKLGFNVGWTWNLMRHYSYFKLWQTHRYHYFWNVLTKWEKLSTASMHMGTLLAFLSMTEQKKLSPKIELNWTADQSHESSWSFGWWLPLIDIYIESKEKQGCGHFRNIENTLKNILKEYSHFSFIGSDSLTDTCAVMRSPTWNTRGCGKIISNFFSLPILHFNP